MYSTAFLKILYMITLAICWYIPWFIFFSVSLLMYFCLVRPSNHCTTDVWCGLHLCAIDRDTRERRMRSFSSTIVFWPLMSLGQRSTTLSWTSITGSSKFYSHPSWRHTTWPSFRCVLLRWVKFRSKLNILYICILPYVHISYLCIWWSLLHL